jgi:SpoVK/Ycf46/Vps4 family AAA+-type ATPase
MADSQETDLLDDFRTALGDCEELYHSAALEALRSHLNLVSRPPGTFVSRMLDLHRGLLLKVFLEIAQIGGKWDPEQLPLAAVLFEHAWGSRLEEDQLREALDSVRAQHDLTWDVLLGPFSWLPPFRERADQLQTVVLRMANLVAKADGRVKPSEVRQLEWIQAELERNLQRIPVADEPSEHASVVVQTKPALAGRAAAAAKTRQPPTPTTAASEEALAEVLAELDELIGLAGIKQELRGLVNFLKVQKARADFDLPRTQISLHAVFRGNPGTGKTTVARLLGRIFGALGLLAKGHLIETDRSGLVAEYAGQTGPKTNKRIDDALDGVLFIDEAYSLVAERGEDPYGAEALQTLLKRMEDDRDRLVVVLAGYPRPLDHLLRSNPGLSSRFSRHLTFPDYSAAELGRIFETFCRRNRYELPSTTRLKLLLGFDHLVRCRDEHFGNARLVRNVFERAIRLLANRIAGIAPLTHELLSRLEPEDIDMEGVPAEVWSDDAAGLSLSCPACAHSSRLPASFLGQSVRCRRCSVSFVADWGEVIHQTEAE